MDNKYWRRCGERKLHSLLMGLQTVETSVENSQKAEINLPHDPVIPLLGIYPKNLISYSTNTCLAMFTAAVFTVARNRNNLHVLLLTNR